MSPSSRASKTVLLVENEPLLLEFVHKILARAGISVLSAATAEAAIRIDHEFTGTIDLLLTAGSMPRLSGPELAERLESGRPGLRVMVMSGYPAACLPLHYGWCFLQKPFSRSALLGKVEEALSSDVGTAVTACR